MNTKTVFDRLQSIDDEVQKLHNTIFALKTTDIQAAKPSILLRNISGISSRSRHYYFA